MAIDGDIYIYSLSTMRVCLFNGRIRIPLKMSSLLEIIHHHQPSSICQNLGQQISTALYDGIPVQTLGRRMPRSAVHVGTSPVVGLTSHDLA